MDSVYLVLGALIVSAIQSAVQGTVVEMQSVAGDSVIPHVHLVQLWGMIVCAIRYDEIANPEDQIYEVN